MPQVTGRKNTKAAKRAKVTKGGRSARQSSRQSSRRSSYRANRGLMEGTGAFLDEALTRLAQLMMTYSLVAVTAFGLIGILLLFAGGYFFNISGRVMAASEMMARSAGFEITAVSVKGRSRTADVALLNAVSSQEYGETLGRSLLHFNLNEAREKIEALGWVKHAAITRLLPGTLHISLQERRPAAVWQNEQDGTLFVVDSDGERIEEVTGDAYPALPVIVGSSDPARAVPVIEAIARVTQALKDIAMRGPSAGRQRSLRPTALRKQLVALTLREDRRWDMKFRDGFSVMLPETDIETAIGRLGKIYARNPFFARGLAYMDMRDPKTIYYKPHDGARTKDASTNS